MSAENGARESRECFESLDKKTKKIMKSDKTTCPDGKAD